MDAFTLEPFLQYGILGIIGFLFLKITGKMFESQMKQFELLINNLMQQKTEPMNEVKESLNMILQAITNHNSRMQDLFNKLSSEINDELDEKKDVIKVLTEIEERSRQEAVEYMDLINNHKLILFEMKKTCGFSLSKKRLGERLIEKGLITPQQLQEILNEQEREEMTSMGIRLDDKNKK